ncbi:hypothetical protein Bbelb_128960 [Branchiostoma belcheri]|nr:hypothetical protein Bbelb_128960 [Branchiostoma belcheri]
MEFVTIRTHSQSQGDPGLRLPADNSQYSTHKSDSSRVRTPKSACQRDSVDVTPKQNHPGGRTDAQHKPAVPLESWEQHGSVGGKPGKVAPFISAMLGLGAAGIGKEQCTFVG